MLSYTHLENGIHDYSNEQYHSSPGISRSTIMEFKKSPRHYWHKYINPNYVKPEQTPAMNFGSAMHTFILEHNHFFNRYVIAPPKPPLLKDVGREAYEKGKLDYAIFFEQNSNKEIICEEDYKQICCMFDEIKKNDQAYELIIDAQYEKSIYWTDPETQLLCKVRPDIWHKNFIVDYKTTNDASERAFQREMESYGYYMQFAMMHEAFKYAFNEEMINFVFLAQEKTEPYLTAIYPLDMDSLEAGVNEFHDLLWQIKACQESNYYPGYPTKTISLPRWSK